MDLLFLFFYCVFFFSLIVFFPLFFTRCAFGFSVITIIVVVIVINRSSSGRCTMISITYKGYEVIAESSGICSGFKHYLMVWKLLRLPDTTRTLTARNYLNQGELPIFHAQRSRFLCLWLVDTCRQASQTIRAGKEHGTMRILATHWSLNCFAVRCRDSQMPTVWLPSTRVAFLGIDSYSK